MLHEIILLLAGHPGSIFTESNDGSIRLVSDLPFIHPSEIALINRLCKLASYFIRFQKFIKTHGLHPVKKDGEDNKEPYGLYVKSFSSGLDQVLDPYRKALLDVEKQLLADPHLTIAHVQCALEEYQLLFPALNSILEQIQSHSAHGCIILEILHRTAACGLPSAKIAILRILKNCHNVLYKQLASWLLHGLLLDPHNEFFIQKVPPRLKAKVTQVEDDDLGVGGITARQLDQIMQMPPDGYESHSHYEEFSIRAEMLPSYIPSRVAGKILFVGESVQMFENDKNKTNRYTQGSILKNAEVGFAKDLHELSSQSTFSLMSFEGVIDKIRSYVAEHLWKMMVEKSDLLGHLRIIKDFYLLGRGELFLAFIDHSHSLLKAPPTATTEHDVNMAFQRAAHNVLLTDETLLQRFKLTIGDRTTAKKTSSTESLNSSGSTETGWNSLGLSYAVEWPLHLLFTGGVLEKYNSLFCFLLAIKRVQTQLQHCWALQMSQKWMKGHQHDSLKWVLRHHMAFLVDNLQYYLQVDVIESQFKLLHDKIIATRDFEEIRLAHDQNLLALLAQSFLFTKPIFHCLQEILQICHTFCALVSHSESTEREQTVLENIVQNFQRQSNLLFLILSNVKSRQTSPHLGQLLLRLDFNKYYTLSGGHLGRLQGQSQE